MVLKDVYYLRRMVLVSGNMCKLSNIIPILIKLGIELCDAEFHSLWHYKIFCVNRSRIHPQVKSRP